MYPYLSRRTPTRHAHVHNSCPCTCGHPSTSNMKLSSLDAHYTYILVVHTSSRALCFAAPSETLAHTVHRSKTHCNDLQLHASHQSSRLLSRPRFSCRTQKLSQRQLKIKAPPSQFSFMESSYNPCSTEDGVIWLGSFIFVMFTSFLAAGIVGVACWVGMPESWALAPWLPPSCDRSIIGISG